MSTRLSVYAIAQVCHEANRRYRLVIGQDPGPSWEEAQLEIHSSVISGVKRFLDNPELSPKQMHVLWMANKLDNGWRWGEIKNVSQKTHPCLVPYERLPLIDQVKDVLFVNIIRTLTLDETDFRETEKLAAATA